ncbi:ORF159 [Staphylococcus phage EW]|uniref:ORF159 n=1 Tax=Staphylococcus phage EW TaxID=2936814 RepID=Q4ZC56_9CAUD|nr:ORF159 [Staphylococcus phage EW]AAX91412.1 ORF159 [Staphylococcus phage EW]
MYQYLTLIIQAILNRTTQLIENLVCQTVYIRMKRVMRLLCTN